MKNYEYVSVIPSENYGKVFLSNGEDTVEVPEIGGIIFEKLKFSNIDQVDKEILKEFGVEVDTKDFLNDLNSINFLVDKNHKVGKLEYSIGKILNKILYSKISYTVYFLLFMSIIFLCSLKKIDFFWNYKYIFIFDNNVNSIIAYTLLVWISVFCHEIMHYLTSSGFKIASKISLGTRMQFLVAQTTILNPYQLSSKERIKVYISGILGDYIVCAICILGIYLVDNTFIASILRCLLYIKTTAIIWQFLFYMKTDIYFVFSTLKKEHNLMNDAQTYLKNKHKNYTSTVKGYAYFLVLGRILTVIYFGIFEFPLLYLLIKRILNSKTSPDGIISSILVISTWIIFMIVFCKVKIIPYIKKLKRGRI
ncbi:hypothetical protein IFO72_09550 [Streptococcus macedonicus]|uniref:hypothetical protein n=1 Tax=Streptococcus macedonicus TaxID=59310 RepID=UPI001899C680|nr:hypothetical protein [Streptococcus macedonicus]MBF6977480.1 hypothetical protein [Streptococcus macedonicus]